MNTLVTTTIEVLKFNIDHGIKCHCTKCPIAIAIDSVLNPNYHSVILGTEIVIVSNGFVESDYYMVASPQSVVDFISNYDWGYDSMVHPFAFNIDIPAQCIA